VLVESRDEFSHHTHSLFHFGSSISPTSDQDCVALPTEKETKRNFLDVDVQNTERLTPKRSPRASISKIQLPSDIQMINNPSNGTKLPQVKTPSKSWDGHAFITPDLNNEESNSFHVYQNRDGGDLLSVDKEL